MKLGDEKLCYVFYLFGVVFVEVCVDVEFGMICVLCIVGVYSVGCLFNVKIVCS